MDTALTPKLLRVYCIQFAENWTPDFTRNCVEALAGLVPEILERMGPETISLAHQNIIQKSIIRLHELTGQSYGTIYEALHNYFRVPRYTEIPESR